MSIKNKNIYVIAGGRSDEREVSLRSGKACFQALQELNYNINFLDLKNIEDIIKIHKETPIDYAFLCTHGNYGEDGRLQGVLDWLDIKYTGSNTMASSLAMNKYITRQVLKSSNLPVAPGGLLNSRDINSLEFPYMLKITESGSSYGVYKINNKKDLDNFIKTESDYKNKQWLYEEFIPGREITVSLLEINNELTVLPVLELRPKNDYYDLEAKYTKGMTEFIIPADFPAEVTQDIKEKALCAFEAVGCTGYGRVDMIVQETNNKLSPIILEINTLPGMTETSDLPAQALAHGISYNSLVELMLLTITP